MIRTLAVSAIALSLMSGVTFAQQSTPPAQSPQSTPPAASKDDEACPPAVTAGMATGMQMMQSMMGAMANIAKSNGTGSTPQDGAQEQKKTQ